MIRVVHHGSRIRIMTFYPSRIPDPGVKKAPDPGSRIRNTDRKPYKVYRYGGDGTVYKMYWKNVSYRIYVKCIQRIFICTHYCIVPGSLVPAEQEPETGKCSYFLRTKCDNPRFRSLRRKKINKIV
jgi:hypothetical protein